jgi:hypothetical protein
MLVFMQNKKIVGKFNGKENLNFKNKPIEF